MSKEPNRTPVVLMVIDGLGLSTSWQGNVFLMSKPENFASIWHRYPHAILAAEPPAATGREYFSDSVINHSAIGSGSFYPSNAELIDGTIEDESLGQNEILKESVQNAGKRYSSIHLLFTLSSTARFSSPRHLIELIKIISQKRSSNVYIHIFINDSIKNKEEARQELQKIEETISRHDAQIASLIGQNRALSGAGGVTSTIKMLALGHGKRALSAEQALSISKGINPSQLEPFTIVSNGSPIGVISDFDSVIIADHFSRPYARLVSSLFEDTGMVKGVKLPKFLFCAGLSSPFYADKEYFKNFLPFRPEPSISQVLADAGCKQTYVSESSRIVHITSYFQSNMPPAKSKNIFYDTDIDFPTYLRRYPDLCGRILNKMVEVARHPERSFIFFELPFLDQISRQGTFDNVLEAVKLLDKILLKLEYIATRLKIPLIITSNYAKIDRFRPQSRSLYDETSGSPVPLVLIDRPRPAQSRSVANFNSQLMAEMVQGRDLLIDIAPTILDLMGLDQPPSMSGKSLLPKLTS